VRRGGGRDVGEEEEEQEEEEGERDGRVREARGSVCMRSWREKRWSRRNGSWEGAAWALAGKVVSACRACWICPGAGGIEGSVSGLGDALGAENAGGHCWASLLVGWAGLDWEGGCGDPEGHGQTAKQLQRWIWGLQGWARRLVLGRMPRRLPYLGVAGPWATREGDHFVLCSVPFRFL
jgi:hypothetical protein